MNRQSDTDTFVLSPRAAYQVAFAEAGFNWDDAALLSNYAIAHPEKLLEDCKLSAARIWAGLS